MCPCVSAGVYIFFHVVVKKSVLCSWVLILSAIVVVVCLKVLHCMLGFGKVSGGRKGVYLYMFGGLKGSAENIYYFGYECFWLVQKSLSNFILFSTGTMRVGMAQTSFYHYPFERLRVNFRFSALFQCHYKLGSPIPFPMMINCYATSVSHAVRPSLSLLPFLFVFNPVFTSTLSFSLLPYFS